jgi:hypothetical protein
MTLCLPLDVPPAVMAVGIPRGQCRLKLDRRNADARARLLSRVRSEFLEMPCLRLTAAQSQRLFGLRDDVCRRVLAGLIGEGILWQGPDGRYGVRASH